MGTAKDKSQVSEKVKVKTKSKTSSKAKEANVVTSTKNTDAKLETNDKAGVTGKVKEDKSRVLEGLNEILREGVLSGKVKGDKPVGVEGHHWAEDGIGTIIEKMVKKEKKEETMVKKGDGVKATKPKGVVKILEQVEKKQPADLIGANLHHVSKPVLGIVDNGEALNGINNKHVHHHLTGGAITTFLITILIFQFVLCIWKKRHRKSFFAITLAGLWLFPAFIFFPLGWWRFMIVWTLASISLLTLAYKATRKPLARGTPRAVYSFFVAVHKVTSWMSIGGYAILMIEIFGLGLIIGMELADFGIMLIGYGIYFGVLSRDWAEVCSSYISTTIGYFSKDGSLPRRSCRFNYCAVCDRELHPSRLNSRRDNRNLQEKTFKMNCGHICHDFCIRGWVMIGKVDTCPVCREKVNISDLFVTPWQKQEKAWASVLDAVRYMVVWNPIIIAVGRFMIYEMGIPMLIEHHVGTRPFRHIRTINTH